MNAALSITLWDSRFQATRWQVSRPISLRGDYCLLGCIDDALQGRFT